MRKTIPRNVIRLRLNDTEKQYSQRIFFLSDLESWDRIALDSPKNGAIRAPIRSIASADIPIPSAAEEL